MAAFILDSLVLRGSAAVRLDVALVAVELRLGTSVKATGPWTPPMPGMADFSTCHPTTATPTSKAGDGGYDPNGVNPPSGEKSPGAGRSRRHPQHQRSLSSAVGLLTVPPPAATITITTTTTSSSTNAEATTHDYGWQWRERRALQSARPFTAISGDEFSFVGGVRCSVLGDSGSVRG